jgi:hypothetical protein
MEICHLEWIMGGVFEIHDGCRASEAIARRAHASLTGLPLSPLVEALGEKAKKVGLTDK